MTIVNLFSQDKHDYATPLGKSIFYREVRDANRVLLRMSEVGPISKGMDGIVLVFNMRQDLSRITRPLKLISFNSTSEEANSHLEIYYHEGTITIRRKTYPLSLSHLAVNNILAMVFPDRINDRQETMSLLIYTLS